MCCRALHCVAAHKVVAISNRATRQSHLYASNCNSGVLQCVAVKVDFNGKSKTVWLLLVKVTESRLDKALFHARHTMYIHVHVCILHEYKRTCTHTHTHTHIHMHTHAHTYTHTCTRTKHAHTCTHTHTHAHTRSLSQKGHVLQQSTKKRAISWEEDTARRSTVLGSISYRVANT